MDPATRRPAPVSEPARLFRTRAFVRWTWFPARTLPTLAVLLLLLCATPLTAQRPDFMFHRPRATLSAVGGWSMPGEGSELFAFTRDKLTVSRGDFASPTFGVQLGLRATSRLDLTLGLEWTDAAVDSEMREFVRQNDEPIVQTTEFEQRRLTAGASVYLLRRGRSISEYAWIPGRWSPFVGAGAGVTWYDFRQYGEFVDYDTWYIFEDRFRSKGRGLTPYVAGGVDVTLSTYFLLRAEYRHYWGTGTLNSRVFVDFGDIDLSGSRASLGIAVRI